MLKLNELNETDRHGIEQLADKHFGKNYFNIENLKTSPESEFYLEYIKTTEIIGFIFYGTVLEKFETIIPSFNINEKTGIIKTIAIDDKHQRKNFGKLLLANAIKNLQKLGVKTIFYIEWKESVSHPAIQKLIGKFNFKLAAEIKNYWREDSIRRKYQCPLCGNPCRCTAQIFIKQLID